MITKEEACKLADKRVIKELVEPFEKEMKGIFSKKVLKEVSHIYAIGVVQGAELMYDVIAQA